jgi:hypothetical protein
MSTPIPQDTELEGLDLYAPRRARAEPAPEGSGSDPQALPLAPECDHPRAEETKQASADDDETVSAAQTRIEDAIKAAIELARSLGDPESGPAPPSLPPTANLRLPIGGLAPGHDDPPFHGNFAQSGPRRRFRLEPEVVPQPPNAARRRVVGPMLVAAMILGAAIIAYAFTVMPAFHPDAQPSKRASVAAAMPVPAVAPTPHEPESEPPPARLVVENQKAFSNEPLSLGVSVAAATGHESLMLAGLAMGTRLSAGTPVSDASWQLSSGDLNGVYVYAPKDFVGTMNTAIELLSPNKRLMESRAVQLEWIAKSKPAAPNQQIGPAHESRAAIRPVDPETARLMERARDLLRSGDVASARLLFRRLADAGMADAALALAATYDPHYLAEHNFIGVAGDEAKARDWYQRASDLGSAEAERILARTATK